MKKLFLIITSFIAFLSQAQTITQSNKEITHELEEIVISVNKEAQKSKWRKYNTNSKKR